MDAEKEDARAAGDGAGREEEASGESRTHERNTAATSRSRKPSFGEMERLIEAGLPLLLLRRRAKIPRHKDWRVRDRKGAEVIEEARQGGFNVGVRLPADVLVLDVDPRNFPKGRNSLEEFVRDTGLDLSCCPRVRTGSGGSHYWFRKPAGVKLRNALDEYEGIEFKSEGRLVVAAGSVHPNGTLYTWDETAPPISQMPPLSERVIELAARPTQTQAHGEPGEISPGQLERALERLDPEDFREHGRWLTLMMACHHATNGEGVEEFIDWSTGDAAYADHDTLIRNRWESLSANAPGGAPVTIATLRQMLHEVGGDIPPPDPEDQFEVWDAGKEARPERFWKFLTIDELDALPPPKWLVPGLFTEGSLGAIYGPPETFKSFLAVDIGMALSSGLAWHGRKVERGGVLYIAAEGASGLGKRIRAWKQDKRAAELPFAFWLMRDEINLAAESDVVVRKFVDVVRDELGSLKLIVIDTLNQTAAGADENSAKDMSRYIASMKRLRDASGAAVVVVHHSGKDVGKGMRGSTALLGAMDTAVEVDCAIDRHSITVKVQKQKDAERAAPMRFNLEKVADSLVLRATMATSAEADFGARANLWAELAAALARQHGGRLPMKTLADAVREQSKSSDRTARHRIDEAIPLGRENAIACSDGTMIWRERADANPKGPINVRAIYTDKEEGAAS